MRTVTTALNHSPLPLSRPIAITDRNSVARTVPRVDGARGARRASSASRTLHVHSGAQAAMLAALGSLSLLLTLVYMLANRPPLVLLLTAPLWSLWLLSFIDWPTHELPARDLAVLLAGDQSGPSKH